MKFQAKCIQKLADRIRKFRRQHNMGHYRVEFYPVLPHLSLLRGRPKTRNSELGTKNLACCQTHQK
ncbi:MAG: hypothetical protein MI674_05970 [Cytophagales bacterium]|nr:hypothetical protein [Cytophagales bacterium]